MARWLTRIVGVLLFVGLSTAPLVTAQRLATVKLPLLPWQIRHLWRQQQLDEQRLQQQLKQLQEQLDEAARAHQPRPVEPLSRFRPIG